MRTTITAFLVSLIAAALLTPLVRWTVCRRGAAGERSGSSKLHERSIARIGGVGIAMAFFAALAALLVMDFEVGQQAAVHQGRLIALMIGGAIVAVMGVYDDLRGLDGWKKLLVEVAVAVLAYWMGLRIERLTFPFGEPIALGFMGLPLTVCWIVGITHALNLLDELDGLAGGASLVAIAMTFVVASWYRQPLMAVMMICLAGAILGLLAGSLHQGSMLGGSGSSFVGFVLSTTVVAGVENSAGSLALVAPVIALGLPIADRLLAVARRLSRGAPLQLDGSPISRTLLGLGLSRRQTVHALFGTSILLGGMTLVLVFASASSWSTTLLLSGVALGSIVILRALGCLRSGFIEELSIARQRSREMTEGVEEITGRLKYANHVEQVWESVKAAAPVLGAAGVALTVDTGKADVRPVTFSEGLDEADMITITNSFDLDDETLESGSLQLGWGDGRKGVDQEVGSAIDELCGHVVSALKRIEQLGTKAEYESIAVQNEPIAPPTLPPMDSDKPSARVIRLWR